MHCLLRIRSLVTRCDSFALLAGASGSCDRVSTLSGVLPDRHHILAIEISNPGAGVRGGDGAGAQASGPGVALGRVDGPGRVELASIEWLNAAAAGGGAAGRFGGLDDDLMPAIARLFAREGLVARACLRAVAVSIGPGGYTSLRIACAAAKMIAEGAGAACISVPTAAAVAAGVGAEHWDRPVGIALASKGDAAWLQVFERGEPTGPGRVLSGDEAAGVIGGVGTLVGDAHLPGAMRLAAERARARMIEPVFSPLSVLVAAAGRPEIDPALCNPLYPREPDAVTLWRARK